jgi:hypothetical protein
MEMKKQSERDKITLEVPAEALEALYNAAVQYQDHILSIPPEDRDASLEQDFDIIVGLCEAFDHVLTERAVQSGLEDIVQGVERLLGGAE